jgi:hypothetical protein
MTVFEIAGVVKYSGLTNIRQISVSRSRGIRPGTINLVLPFVPSFIDTRPQPVILHDTQREIVLPDCAFESLTPNFSNGEESLISLFDYRWRWQFGQISGEYNEINGGVILPESKRHIRDLAELCLKELKVVRYDVSALPTDVFPTVSWDLNNPAQALESLISEYGFIVCPQLDGSVRICKNGVGLRLPSLRGQEVKPSFVAKIVPDFVYVHAQPTVWEVSIPLGKAFAVERDAVKPNETTTESIVPLDEASYKPKSGWGLEPPKAFPNIAETLVNKNLTDIEKIRERDRLLGLAKESVWRIFGFEFPLKLPEAPFEIKSINELVFLDELLAETVVDYVSVGDSDKKRLNTQVRRQRPFLYGRFHLDRGDGTNNVDKFSHDYHIDQKLIFDGSFTIDKSYGVIKVSKPLYIYDSTDDKECFKLPEVYLRVAVSIMSAKDRNKYRSVFKQKTGFVNGTNPLHVSGSSRREIILDREGKKIEKDNIKDVEKELKTVLSAKVEELKGETPETRVYQGFYPIELDGTIQQVSYEIDGSGFTRTVASYGIEHIENVRSFEERKRVERTDAFIKRQQEFQKQQVVK